MKNSMPFMLVFLFSQHCLAPLTFGADARDEKIQALEKRLEEIERKYRALEEKHTAPSPPQAVQEEQRPEKPKSSPLVSLGQKGFVVQSADTNFMLRLRGLIQFDSRNYAHDGSMGNNDTFYLRSARFVTEGTIYRDFDFLFQLNFGGTQKNLVRDAWLNFSYSPALQLRAGKMKPPLGVERWQGAANTLFLERSFVSGLAPGRDVGLMLLGELFPGAEPEIKVLGFKGVLNYGIGVFNGAADDQTAANFDFDDEKTGMARVFLQPFLKTDLKFLKGFGLGIAGSYGSTESASGLPGAYATEGVQEFFTYRLGKGTTVDPSVIADGTHWRLFPQVCYYYGPFSLMAEGGLSSQQLRLTAGPATTYGSVTHIAWQITGSYLLTGEQASFRGVEPKRAFDPRFGGWGAWEIVARVSQLDLADEAFPLFADPVMSATRAAAWSVGLNWYLNKNVRAGFNFIQTDFKQGDAGVVSRQTENALLVRMQLAF